MAASTNPNGLRVVLPNAGGGFAVQGSEIAAATIGVDNLVANTITSAGIAKDVIQHSTVAITSANILAMYAAPVALIAAPGAGKNIVVHKVMMTMVTTATVYANGGVVVFQIAATANGGGTATTATIAAAVVNAVAGTSYTTVIPVSYTGTANTGLYISNQTAAFITGTGTATVDIWYSIQ